MSKSPSIPALTENGLIKELRAQDWSVRKTDAGHIAMNPATGKTFAWHSSVFTDKGQGRRAWWNFLADMKRVGFDVEARQRTLPCPWSKSGQCPKGDKKYASLMRRNRHIAAAHDGLGPDGSVIVPKKAKPVVSDEPQPRAVTMVLDESHVVEEATVIDLPLPSKEEPVVRVIPVMTPWESVDADLTALAQSLESIKVSASAAKLYVQNARSTVQALASAPEVDRAKERLEALQKVLADAVDLL